jgi:hypothetical protein
MNTSDLSHIAWKDALNSVRLTKPNGDVLDISVGDFIKVKDSIFKVDEFFGNPKDIGPVYFSYREFDTSSKSFIEIPFSLKTGSKSFIICYPCGTSKYGFHLNNDEWSSIVVCETDPTN